MSGHNIEVKRDEGEDFPQFSGVNEGYPIGIHADERARNVPGILRRHAEKHAPPEWFVKVRQETGRLGDLNGVGAGRGSTGSFSASLLVRGGGLVMRRFLGKVLEI